MPPRSRSAPWTEAQAERHLHSLELFGMRFGLDRMRRMMTALGTPSRRFDSIQVVGTNGKTSTTRMIAAILERHGLRTGAYLSPHLTSYAERVQIGERDLDTSRFAAAIARAALAAEQVNRTLAEDDHVTQFELLTAAAFWELADREVQVAVVEAGLGARYDATSVIEPCVTVLTNVGLEHTRWLGPTVRDIAEEKLAAVRPGTTLALGPQLAPEALAVARRVAEERGVRIVSVAEDATSGSPETPLLARGAFQRRNFALARVAAEAYLESLTIEQGLPGESPFGEDAAHEDVFADAARSTFVRGRFHVVGEDPLTLLDGAHNPHAVGALVESLSGLLGERPLALVLGVLEDKDAAGMLGLLLPLCARAWFTVPASTRALSPATLQSLARQLGFGQVVCEPKPAHALAEARAWALARPGGGAVLATGSVYLVGELLARLDHPAEAGHSTGGGRSAQREGCSTEGFAARDESVAG
ncbi:MAG TPA: cyanophycin synthetase [Solirubrobacteraceae bacterium]|jgi:dihydrofolate synthase/folylpolyglutamate synthase